MTANTFFFTDNDAPTDTDYPTEYFQFTDNVTNFKQLPHLIKKAKSQNTTPKIGSIINTQTAVKDNPIIFRLPEMHLMQGNRMKDLTQFQ
ncbi:hypothetical protein [Stenoxybacter acetivorans]|uniref:hypothetical protein n=1 Tax=Stenoxybacter acetivorans TaxID=422441 RepID=UPI000565B963|nr:hypothetical protein [Stenoxybacter acetivorans]